MLKKLFPWLALAGVFVTTQTHASGFATSVIAYEPGAGFASDFTNPSTALGEPTRTNPFGDAVDPFNAPYGQDDLVSVGAGGWLTVEFAAPIFNDPNNPFGLDFIIYGNTGFVVTNAVDESWNWIGTPRTDGSLYGDNSGSTRVSVSANGVEFFELSPSLTPVVDTLFPTDGSGVFGLPVNPALASGDFVGQSLAGIRGLYAGSGGGTGFDLSWARDGGGNAVALEAIRFVRVNVLSGKAEIDAFAAVPEPGTWALLALGALALVRVFRARIGDDPFGHC